MTASSRDRATAGLFAALAIAGLMAAAMLGTAGAAMAWTAQTTGELNLRQRPALHAPVLLTMPAGSGVEVASCAGAWCNVTWRGYTGYASKTGLTGAAKGAASTTFVIPIDPNYPYREGYYPTADSYFKYPPYAEERAGFYPKRYLLSPREWDRYRYRPHIFSGKDAAAE